MTMEIFVKGTTDCVDCPLRRNAVFRTFSQDELAFVSRFKTGELKVEAGATVLVAGTRSPHLFTVLSGWGFREKTLENGRRSILNFVLPGDLIGLQSALFAEMDHSVEALTNLTLCVFQRSEVEALFRQQPGLAYTVVWHAAREERMLDEQLLSLGRRNALERIAYLLLVLFARARRLGLAVRETWLEVPITQTHVADTLGLSLVHTNKTLRKLSAEGLIVWKAGRLRLSDEAGLTRAAGYEPDAAEALPLI